MKAGSRWVGSSPGTLCAPSGYWSLWCLTHALGRAKSSGVLKGKKDAWSVSGAFWLIPYLALSTQVWKDTMSLFKGAQQILMWADGICVHYVRQYITLSEAGFAFQQILIKRLSFTRRCVEFCGDWRGEERAAFHWSGLFTPWVLCSWLSTSFQCNCFLGTA